MTTPDPNAPADTTPAPSSSAPAHVAGDVVAVDSFDSYAGKDVTDVFLVVQATDLPDEGPRVALAHLGNLTQLANLPAAAIRVL